MNALLGRTVYGNGSYAPTRGQVSAQGAQGYLQRELRNRVQLQQAMSPALPATQGNVNLFGGVSKVGSDGQSDTRSGVARRILANTFTPSVPQTAIGYSKAGDKKGGGKKGGGGNRPGGGRPGNGHGSTPGTKPEQPGTTTPNPNTPTPTDPGTPSDPANPTPSVPTPPQVQVNPDGTLNLPYDAQFGWDAVNATSQMNEQLLALQLEQQKQAMEYGRTKRDYDLGYDDLKRDTLNEAAATGSAYSSAYGNKVSRNARGYNNQMDDLNQYNGLFQNNMLMRRYGIQNHYNAMMQAAAMALAEKLRQQAGDIGLPGTDPTDPTNGGGGTGDLPGTGEQGPDGPGTDGGVIKGGGSGGRPVVKPPKGGVKPPKKPGSGGTKPPRRK